MQVPDAAINYMLFAEVGSQRDYTPSPKWPGGASGVTIGIGYDLGYHLAAEIAVDWQDHLSNNTLKRLLYASRVIGTSAESARQGLSDVAVPFDAAVAVFRARQVPRYAEQTESAFRNCDLLPAQSFGALVSLVSNRGANTDPTPSRMEMAQIAEAMAACRFADVPGYIRQMRRLWTNADGQPRYPFAGLVARREAEAAMFAYGLTKEPPDPKALADWLDTEIKTAEA